MQLTGESLIGARRAPGRPGAFRAIDPATGEHLDPPYPEALPEEIDQACESAWAAFDVYREIPREARAALLDEFFDRRGIEKATGMPFARNFPAVFNYKAQGWRHEGTFRGHAIAVDGSARLDQFQFGLTKAEWHGLHAGRAA